MLNRTPKPLVQTCDQVSSFCLFVKYTFVHYTQKLVELIYRSLVFLLATSGDKIYRLFDYNESDTTVTSQHRPEVEATIANSSILLHSDWLASSNRCKPIRMPYLRIFATVTFNLTTAKISKYSALIGLLRLDEAS